MTQDYSAGSSGIRHNSIVDEIVRQIEQRIERGELAPEQRLHEEACAAEWKVSRPSLREAFRVLESQGYIQREPRKGVCVTRITPRKVLDVYQMRSVLEGLAVRLMVERGSDLVLRKLEDLDKRMRAANAIGDLAARAVLNQDFHSLMINASGNEVLREHLIPINKMIKRCRAIAQADPSLLTDSDETHVEIIDCMRRGDAEAAERLRRQRILQFGELIAQRVPLS